MTMLGYVSLAERGDGDRLLAKVALRLLSEGAAVAGVVQVNTKVDPNHPCQMHLQVLPGGTMIRISQNLGPEARGCRLDPSALEMAVAQVEATLDASVPRLLIVNKFGKHEGDGRGFRPLIGKALELGVPVLTSVSARNRDGFEDFAETMAQPILPDEAAVMRWCRTRMAG